MNEHREQPELPEFPAAQVDPCVAEMRALMVRLEDALRCFDEGLAMLGKMLDVLQQLLPK